VQYLCDTSRWPVAVISAPPGCDPEAIDPGSFYAHTDRLLAHGEPFALLYDLRHSGRLSAERRRRFAEYVKANEDRVARCLIAYASLVDSEWQRGLLTAVLWFLTPPRPHRAFSEVGEAMTWLQGMLEGAGVVRADDLRLGSEA
jgi:hypothetical protein